MTPAEDLDTLQAWSLALEDANYYEVLGVLEIADDEAIADAFRRFAVAFHPDVQTAASQDARACVTRIFCVGVEAYRVLKDPTLRRRYDEALMRGELRLRSDSEGPPSGARRYASLEDLCKTPSSRLHARRADTYIGCGDLLKARTELQHALADENYENPELEERLEALELALFATGR